MLSDFSELPDAMKNRAVRAYYDMLSQKRASLFLKRVFDIVASASAILLFSPLLLAAAAMVRWDSPGPVFYRQTRVTRNMKRFRIFKFRTMVENADRKGPLVTAEQDQRVTKIGRKLRRSKLDELPQLFNVLAGDMTFVGTRPEVPRYVGRYNDEMLATLLLPAGITSEASVRYRDEARLLKRAANAEKTYIDVVLPQKMVYNLEYLRDFSFFGDFRILGGTLFAVVKKK